MNKQIVFQLDDLEYEKLKKISEQLGLRDVSHVAKRLLIDLICSNEEKN